MDYVNIAQLVNTLIAPALCVEIVMASVVVNVLTKHRVFNAKLMNIWI